MRSLEIIDDIVYEKKDDTFSLLTATQIYDLGAEMGERGIRLSKLSLDAKIQFEFQNDEIFVMLSVKKNGVEFFIKKNGSHFLDYAIISEVWYYLSFDNAFFNSIIEKEKIDISKSITFGEYLSLKKSLGKNNIDYIDNVETEINHVKSFSPNDIDYYFQRTEVCKANGNDFKFAPCPTTSPYVRTITTREGSRLCIVIYMMKMKKTNFYGINYRQTGKDFIRPPLKNLSRCLRTHDGGGGGNNGRNKT